GDHYAGGHRMLTTKDLGVGGANPTPRFPSIGSIVNREVGARRPGMPGYVAVPMASSIGLSPGYFGGQFLGAQHNPFQPGGDPNAPNYQVSNFNLASGLTVQRLEDRRSLVRHFDAAGQHVESLAESRAMDRFAGEAFEFVSG